MKRVLFASTAVAALGLAGAAQASDPIALKLGGYSSWAVGYADQSDTYEAGTSAAGAAQRGKRQRVDVKGSNEVWFLGSTTLDNGVKIGVDMQLEAGGYTDATADPIDEAYITVDGGFGRFILGSENNAAYLLHVSAPDAAGLSGEAELGFIRGIWVDNAGTNAMPSWAGSTLWTSALNSDNDAAKITYFTPNFGGFTAGISYIPTLDGTAGAASTNPSGDNHLPHAQDAGSALTNPRSLTDMIALGAAYNGTIGGVGLKVALGYFTILDTNPSQSLIDDFQQFSVGAQVSYAGFTLGGGWKISDSSLAAGGASPFDGQVWNVGLMYSTGPFAVGAMYHGSQFEGAAGGSEDSTDIIQVSGSYNMGPGVKAIASIGFVDFERNNVDANDGWAAMTALVLSF